MLASVDLPKKAHAQATTKFRPTNVKHPRAVVTLRRICLTDQVTLNQAALGCYQYHSTFTEVAYIDRIYITSKSIMAESEKAVRDSYSF